MKIQKYRCLRKYNQSDKIHYQLAFIQKTFKRLISGDIDIPVNVLFCNIPKWLILISVMSTAPILHMDQQRWSCKNEILQ